MQRPAVAATPEPPGDWSRAVAHLAAADPKLAPLIERHGPPTIAPTTDLVPSLARAIVGQQLSGAAARTIWGRFLALYPGGQFPRAAAVVATADADLRAAGLSAAKAAAIKDLAGHVASASLVPARLAAATDDEVAAMLLPVRGIGPWSVDMFLMFALCRPDVLPVGDLGVRRAAQEVYALPGMPTPNELFEIGEPWRPHRSLASLYLWRSLDNEPA